MVIQCCACKRVQEEGAWKEVANPESLAATASHGFCPPCEANAYAEMHRYFAAMSSLTTA